MKRQRCCLSVEKRHGGTHNTKWQRIRKWQTAKASQATEPFTLFHREGNDIAFAHKSEAKKTINNNLKILIFYLSRNIIKCKCRFR
jgi:hypothetical protein